MSKPLLLARSSGLHIRFRVPADPRTVAGARFIVRPLCCTGDAARLAAAYIGVALSGVFDGLRGAMDIKKAVVHSLEKSIDSSLAVQAHFLSSYKSRLHFCGPSPYHSFLLTRCPNQPDESILRV
jgi:hypothetical protein